MAGRDSASVCGGLAAAVVVVDSGVRNWRASEWQKRRWQQTALFFALLCFLVNFVASVSDPGESKCAIQFSSLSPWDTGIISLWQTIKRTGGLRVCTQQKTDER